MKFPFSVVEASRPPRTIRSFVRRDSRITPAQRRALAQLWPRYGIPESPTPLEWSTVFGRHAPVILEIGFGNGETLAGTAAAHPENNYLGIEVHRPGVGSLLRRLEAQELENVRVMLADAGEVLAQRVPDASLAAVHLFFPDPWPKKRHHKRRLVQPEFAALVARKLVPDGYFHLATDWPDYAKHMVMVLSKTAGLTTVTDPRASLADIRPSTKFEQRGRQLGHQISDLVFQRSSDVVTDRPISE